MYRKPTAAGGPQAAPRQEKRSRFPDSFFHNTRQPKRNSIRIPTIIGEIKRYFRDKGWAMKVPRKLKELSVRIPEMREALERKNGRTPTAAEDRCSARLP